MHTINYLSMLAFLFLSGCHGLTGSPELPEVSDTIIGQWQLVASWESGHAGGNYPKWKEVKDGEVFIFSADGDFYLRTSSGKPIGYCPDGGIITRFYTLSDSLMYDNLRKIVKISSACSPASAYTVVYGYGFEDGDLLISPLMSPYSVSCPEGCGDRLRRR